MVLYEVHPQGDLVITLHNPNAPFAVKKPALDDLEHEPDDIPIVNPDTNGPAEDATHIDCLPEFRVSSSHLILSSDYFKRMLTGPWSESTAEDGMKRASAHDWDEKAFLALMNIIHGRNREVPREVTREFVAKIAAMVDYYKCHEAIDLWFLDIWKRASDGLTYSNRGLLVIFERDLTLRLFISWVFAEETGFPDLTRYALWVSTGPLDTLGLAFPVDVIDEIEKCRQTLIGEVMECINEVFISLRKDDNCSFECSSMMLGALLKELRSKGIPFPLPTAPYLGFDLSTLIKNAQGFKKLEWLNKSHKCSSHGNNVNRNSYGSYGARASKVEEGDKDKCDCNLNALIVPRMQEISQKIVGCAITDFLQSG